MSGALNQGLTSREAANRLASVGPNELPRTRRRGLLQIAAETMREPMFVLLIGAAILYVALGDLGEGLFLLAGALASIGLVIFQEARSERTLEALRELAQPHIRVLRDGVEQRIAARELVPGDVYLIGEGERIPADGLLLAGDVLSVDESTLTGESAPVEKRFAVASDAFSSATVPGEDYSPYLFSSAMTVRGQGLVRVERTGTQSALGRIGASLAAIRHEQTPLQRTAGRLVTLLGAFALGFSAIVALAYGLLRHDWIGGALAGITIAISLIPEEFPMVLAVFMALGAWRLATHRVLTRRSAVIEALGAATVLCVDKTGTLTENRMRIARLWTEADDYKTTDAAAPTGKPLELLKIASLASAANPVDPMDKAIKSYLSSSSPQNTQPETTLERAWPLRPDMLAIIQVWRHEGGRRVAAAKGAPEAIFRLCQLAPEQSAHLMGVVQHLASEGLRVLGVASCAMERVFPETPEQARFQFVGLLGFVDPLRTDVPEALREARDAGINVILITGDHPATAAAIARTAGIPGADDVVLGAKLAQASLSELQTLLRHARVFARIAPEQKLKIVEALKANGEIVAMTGDGVNDAPALEAAHIAIAMGRRGTDVAREASDLVLLDDSFASIVGGVRLGRRIFTNLRRALIYITAIHVPIAGLALIPILLGLPPMLFAMHVVLLELAIDPICALVFESEPSEKSAMKQPPRRSDEPLFGMRQLSIAIAQGAAALAAILGLYVWLLQSHPPNEARGAAFFALAMTNLVLALADAMSNDGRLFEPHRRIFWIIAGALVSILALVFLVPGLSAIFAVAMPDRQSFVIAAIVALISGAWMSVAMRTRQLLLTHAGNRASAV